MRALDYANPQHVFDPNTTSSGMYTLNYTATENGMLITNKYNSNSSCYIKINNNKVHTGYSNYDTTQLFLTLPISKGDIIEIEMYNTDKITIYNYL